MKTMLLAAGKGTRLAPLTDKTPKPLLPVGGKPLIFHLLGQLQQAGVNEVVINTHHLGEQIEQALSVLDPSKIRVHFSREEELLETGGGIKKALPILQQSTFWLCNADIFADFDFNNLPTQLLADDLAHLVLVPKPASRDTGDFAYANGRITARGGDYVYAGIALIHRDLFQGSPDSPFSLRDLLFAATAQNRIAAQIHLGAWTDIGTPNDYERIRGSTNTA